MIAEYFYKFQSGDGYVWTEAVSGKKKLRIQSYPDSSGRGLRIFQDSLNKLINGMTGSYVKDRVLRMENLDLTVS